MENKQHIINSSNKTIFSKNKNDSQLPAVKDEKITPSKNVIPKSNSQSELNERSFKSVKIDQHININKSDISKQDSFKTAPIKNEAIKNELLKHESPIKNEKTKVESSSIKMKNHYILSSRVGEDDLREVKENFEDPSLYLEDNPKLVIGRTPFPHLNMPATQRLIPTRPLSTRIQKKSSSLFSRSVFNKSNQHSRPVSSVRHPANTQPDKQENSHRNKYFTRQSKEELMGLFDEKLERQEELNKEKTNDLMTIHAAELVKHKYEDQENLLKKYEKESGRMKKLAKNIAKHINKKESELLINTSENYRLKSQIIEYLNMKKPLVEKFGNNYWMFTLRRNTDVETLRKNFVNIGGTNGKEIWNEIIDFSNNPFEAIQFPNNQLIKNKYSNIASSKYFLENMKKNGVYLPDMDAISNLKITGKNALKEEKKNFNKYFSENDKIRLYNFEKPGVRSRDILFKKHYTKPETEICKCKAKSRLYSSKSASKRKEAEKIPLFEL